MSEFIVGDEVTATIVFRNSTEGTFNYRAVLYLGVGALASSEKTFSLVAGQSESIIFPLIMPSVAGTYHAFIDIFVNDVLVKHFQATEDIVIVSGLDPGYLNFAVVGVNWRPTILHWNATIQIGPLPNYGMASFIAEGGNRQHDPSEAIQFRVPIEGNVAIGEGVLQFEVNVREYLWSPYPRVRIDVGGTYSTGPNSNAQFLETFIIEATEGGVFSYNDGG